MIGLSNFTNSIWKLARQEIATFLVVGSTLLVLLLMGWQVATRLSALRSAPHENVQWALAQVDVELLAFDVAVRRASINDPESLGQVRLRFDVFHSRIKAIGSMPVIANNQNNGSAATKLGTIQEMLDQSLQIINGRDQDLVAHLPDLAKTIEELRPVAMQLTLSGVKSYTAEADNNRNDFIQLLAKTAFVNALLILTLGTLLLVLLRQTRISKRRANELQASSDRNANTVNASLDAIVVMDMQGLVVDFNPAATQAFGYSRNAALGAPFTDLLRFPEIGGGPDIGLDWFKKAEARNTVGNGRIEMTARNADGNVFPVELSLGSATGPEGPLVIAYIRNISERIAAERNLLSARDAALEGVRAKSQFLAIMSHEMRTPLNGVMALLDLLSVSKLNRKQKNYVKTATTSAEILKQHVDDVLDITRIQAGKFELFPQTFNFVQLLEEVQSINYATAKIRGNRINVGAAMPEPYFVGDRKRIHQVLMNLVGNAIKFTENGDIQIAVDFVGAKADVVTIEVSVTDTGVGIANEQHQRIFEDFVTLDTSYQRNAAGTGLGLPICRSIVEAMNGCIGVESEIGKGSRFWFRISLKAAFRNLEAKNAESEAKNKFKITRRLKVLLVEDNETNRFVASEMLIAANCQVVEASDGREGVKLACATRFDLILMDISMPQLNGWDAARAIKGAVKAKSKSTPIYALTAQAAPEEQAALLEAGMQGCIIKPLRARKLGELLEDIRGHIISGRKMPRSTLKKPKSFKTTIDLAVVDELRSILGSPEFSHRLKLYVDETKHIEKALTQHVHDHDWGTLAQSAHRYAGSAAMFGALALRKSLLDLERIARADDSAKIAAQINAVKMHSNKTLQELAAQI